MLQMQRKWILKSTDQSESFQATLKCRWQHNPLNPVSSKQLWLLQKKIVLMSCGEGKEAHTKKVLYRISKQVVKVKQMVRNPQLAKDAYPHCWEHHKLMNGKIKWCCCSHCSYICKEKENNLLFHDSRV